MERTRVEREHRAMRLELLQSLLTEVDCRVLFGSYMPLRPLRGDQWVGNCPLHKDDRESLVVDMAHGVWYCFGHGGGGGVVDFICGVEACSPLEGLKRLARAAGKPLSEETLDRLAMETSVASALLKARSEILLDMSTDWPASPPTQSGLHAWWVDDRGRLWSLACPE